MQPSRFFIAGLAILGVLSVGDLAAPLLTDGEAPPMSIALMLSAVGLASLAAIYGVLRGSRTALVALFVLRGLSALSAVPAFFVPGVPPGPKTLAGIAIAATFVGIVLVLSGRRVPGSVR